MLKSFKCQQSTASECSYTNKQSFRNTASECSYLTISARWSKKILGTLVVLRLKIFYIGREFWCVMGASHDRVFWGWMCDKHMNICTLFTLFTLFIRNETVKHCCSRIMLMDTHIDCAHASSTGNYLLKRLIWKVCRFLWILMSSIGCSTSCCSKGCTGNYLKD